MRQFFKFLFASILGFFLSFLLIIVLLFAIIASATRRDPVSVSENSIFHLQLNTAIVDRSTESPGQAFDFMSLSPSRAIGLNELLLNIKKAKADENIRGIFLDLTFTQAGWSTLSEIRSQILDFKESGKFVIAYGEMINQRAYYLASTADQIFISPEGLIDFRGLNAQVMFIKNLLDKVGVQPQLIRHGKYKSAAEPFFLERLSPENRTQIVSYANSIWNSILRDISEQRNLSLNELNQIADNYRTRNPEMALEAGMIDGVLYRDEVMSLFREKLGFEENKKLNLVNFNRYRRAAMPQEMIPRRSREKIAVVYGSGNIVMGSGAEWNMGADRIASALREARRDTTVKAIVFRINSGGGSALASEIMLREAMLATQEKPFIVSMGDVAASGGYYIACYADEIIANPTTITGSIGVFGLFPNMQDFLNNKLGITFDNVKTNELADLYSFERPLRRIESEILQESVERIYETFINHVAQGRDLPLNSVEEIAQGRVWSGVDAKRIGLIDDFGGLNYAIERAASLAGLDTYRLVEYPVQKDLLERLRESFEVVETRFIKARLGEAYPIYEHIQRVNEYSGILMRLPYDVELE